MSALSTVTPRQSPRHTADSTHVQRSSPPTQSAPICFTCKTVDKQTLVFTKSLASKDIDVDIKSDESIVGTLSIKAGTFQAGKNQTIADKITTCNTSGFWYRLQADDFRGIKGTEEAQRRRRL